MDTNSDPESSLKQQNNLVVRMDKDSDENLQALFDSVLNPSDSRRPLAVPFRMRKLPNSFFNPPATGSKSPSVSHSRANSTDSAYDAESQANVNKASGAAAAAACFNITGLQICHSRAHSSPASLQQTYKDHNTSDNKSSDSNAIKSSEPPGLNKTRQSRNNQDTIQAVHMKQRSYDVVSPIQLQNELGSLPAGWEQAKTNDGQIYYLNHITKTTQWEDPRIQFRHEAAQQMFQQQAGSARILNKPTDGISDPLGPLPQGWEQAFTDSGDMYFINHVDRTTSWNDPRLQFLQKQLIAPKPEHNWLHVPHIEKEKELFGQNQQQQQQAKQNSSPPMDPFLSSDNHTRQESGDSGLSLSSNKFSSNAEFIPQVDDSMDCMSESGNISSLSGLDCPDNLVSSLQLEDNMCNDMLGNVHTIIDSSSPKLDNLEWYKIN